MKKLFVLLILAMFLLSGCISEAEKKQMLERYATDVDLDILFIKKEVRYLENFYSIGKDNVYDQPIHGYMNDVCKRINVELYKLKLRDVPDVDEAKKIRSIIEDIDNTLGFATTNIPIALDTVDLQLFVESISKLREGEKNIDKIDRVLDKYTD